MKLAEACHFGWPVILLHIDISGVVAAPWRQDILVPQALEIGRYTWGAGRSYEQIASILEVQFLKVGIRLAEVGIALQLHISRKSRYRVRCGTKFKRHTPEQR